MGYSLSWYAVRGKTPQESCEQFGLETTGEREPLAESALVGIQLPGGWYVIVANQGAEFGIPVDVERLSLGGELIWCFIEEHVMYCCVEQWVDGQKKWSLVHDSGCGISHLKMEGELPPGSGAIRDRIMAKQQPAGGSQAEVDCAFDVPIELAEALTGFRHDVEFVDDPFEVLEVNPTIAAGVGFRLRRVVANFFGKLVLAAVLAVFLLGIGVALFGFLTLIVTIVQHLV